MIEVEVEKNKEKETKQTKPFFYGGAREDLVSVATDKSAAAESLRAVAAECGPQIRRSLIA